jgi:hypothetical protein
LGWMGCGRRNDPRLHRGMDSWEVSRPSVRQRSRPGCERVWRQLLLLGPRSPACVSLSVPPARLAPRRRRPSGGTACRR